MSPLTTLVRTAIEAQIQSRKDDHTSLDVLRTFQQQAHLMFETEQVKDTLHSDPFDHLSEVQPQVKRLCTLLQVTDCHRVLAKSGYCYTEAVVRLSSDTAMRSQGVMSHLDLTFRYERQDGSTINEPSACKTTAASTASKAVSPQATAVSTTVWYSIDVSRDNGPNERCLCVQVFAAGPTPSPLPAQNIEQDDGDDADEWDDMDDVEDRGVVDAFVEDKTPCLPMKNANHKDKNDGEGTGKNGADDGAHDRFLAEMDADVLNRFIQWTQLNPIDEATAFFLLMSFPFYEHEWDLAGYVLESVFGFEVDHGDEDDDDDNS
jgi:hypothetical protein